MKKRKEQRKKSRITRFIGWTIFLLLFIIGGLLTFFYFESKQLANDIHDPLGFTSNTKLKNKEPVAILLLGVDERPDDPGRSDTMIVMTINPYTERLTLVSLPRDMYVDIPNRDGKDKLNHAYIYGGIPLTTKTIENVLRIPIDYAVQVNMEAFRDVVNALGGIDVISPLDFDLEGYHINKGPIHLDGEKALKYVRMRKEDPRGDFGRQERQRQVLEAVIEKGTSVQSVLRYRSLFDAVSTNVKTNLTFDEMMYLQKHYMDATNDIRQLSFEEEGGAMINNIWYYTPEGDELRDMQKQLRNELRTTKKSE